MSLTQSADMLDAHVSKLPKHDVIGLRIGADHEDLRADLAEAALAIERLRALVALPDAKPQLSCSARARLVLARPA